MRLLLVVLVILGYSEANSPPKFLLDGSDAVGGDIVVRLKEGPDTPVGTKILILRGFDPDGDALDFGYRGETDLLEIESDRSGEAAVFLGRLLDAEIESSYQILLTLTDGKIGAGKFITQSLLILVEDVNDNAPVFLPFPSSVSVPEHFSGTGAVIAEIEATDKDSGIFGQGRNSPN
jgi:cadherin 23